MRRRPTILIASYLEPEYAERIAASADCDLRYAPELLPRPRYRNDHLGVPPGSPAAQPLPPRTRLLTGTPAGRLREPVADRAERRAQDLFHVAALCAI